MQSTRQNAAPPHELRAALRSVFAAYGDTPTTRELIARETRAARVNHAAAVERAWSAPARASLAYNDPTAYNAATIDRADAL